jgi:hypothetical protein
MNSCKLIVGNKKKTELYFHTVIFKYVNVQIITFAG